MRQEMINGTQIFSWSVTSYNKAPLIPSHPLQDSEPEQHWEGHGCQHQANSLIES